MSIIGDVSGISSRKSKLRLGLFLCLFCSFAKRRLTMIISANSFSKPSIRKHSCFEKLFVEGNLHQHQQEKQPAFPFPFSSSPPSPGKKAHPRIYTCICFFLCFFITMAAFLRCNNLEMQVSVEKASLSKGQVVYAAGMEKPIAMPALRGLGSVYRKGTKAMSDLVVAHVAEHTSLQDLRLFLRTLHRSGVTARADIVFLFAWDTSPSAMVDVIHEENRYFDKLMHMLSIDQQGVYAEVNNGTSSLSSSSVLSSPASASMPCTSCTSSNASTSPFNMNAFRKSVSENDLPAQPLWGMRNLNASQANRTDGTVSIDWGSIVGFDVSELNPDDALQGFIDGPPLVLRRWACYQMLLGMVRHKFKHILLTDVSGVAILRDPFTTMAKRRLGLYLSLEDRAWGASLGDELGLRLGSLDAELNMESEHVIRLSNVSNLTGIRRQLYAHGQELRSGGENTDSNSVAADEGNKSDIRMPGLSQDRIASPRKAGKQHAYSHRRNSGGRRRRSRKAPAAGGLYERVYGRRMWSSLEENERKKKLVNSAVIMGSLQQIRGLANAMVTEIVKVALERKNREAFPDSVLLSYLLHKSTSVLGKRVVEHLHLMDNSESFVHCLVGSEQPSYFFKRTRVAYPIIHGNSKGKRWGNVVRAIRRDLCSSPADAMVYTDCSNLF